MRTVSFAEDRSLTWSTSTSGSLEPMIRSRIMPTYLQLFFEMMTFKDSIRNGTKFQYQWRKSHLMISWNDCTNWEYVSLINSKPYWNCSTWRFTRKYRCTIIKKLKTTVKSCIDQKLRLRNLDVRHERIWTSAVVKSQKRQSGVHRGTGICCQWKEKG